MTNISCIIKQFTDKFQEPISNDLICVICKSIIANAHQGICGCKYCKQCVDEYFINGRKCPGRKSECHSSDIEDIVIDHGINVKLNHLKVKCLNKKCEFVSELCDIESHMKECQNTYVNCPFSVVGCLQNDINREIMSIHFTNSSFKHSTLLMNYLKDIKLESQQMNTLIIEKMDNVQSDFEGKLISLKQESEKNEKKITLLNHQLNDCAQREHIKDGKIKELEQMLQRICIEFHEFKDAQKCRNVIEESRLIIEYLKNQKLLKTVNKMRQMELLTGRIDKLESILKKENTFIWKVDNFTEKMKSAKLGKDPDLISEPFTVYKNGYNLKLRLTPNGHKTAEGKFMSVFFCLEKGKSDELISWPIKDEIIIDLINQDNGNSYISQNFNYVTATTNDKASFDRPCENPRYFGNYRFINISELSKSFLVKNDTIIFTCYVRI